jgi:hypothetical protein
MLARHEAGGINDFYSVAPEDTFDLGTGTKLDAAEFGNFIAGYAAGYNDSLLDHFAVRTAGSIYGCMSSRGAAPNKYPGMPTFYGDDYGSVFNIESGYHWGQLARAK